jgi:hypothetical protein
VLVCTNHRPSMWSELATAVRKALDDGIALREQVVIARKGASVAAAAAELKSSGIPVLYVGELMERLEVKDILAVIQTIVEKSPRALLRVGDFATPRMTSADVRATLEAVSQDTSLQRAGWLKAGTLPLSASGQASRQDLAHKLRGLSWSTSPWDFFCELLLERRFLLADLTDDSIDGHLRRLAQWQFAYMSRVGDGDKRRPTLFRLLNRLRLRQQIRDVYIDRELPPETNGLEGVRVMTLHASKGLEFRAVQLVAVNGKHFAGASDSNPLLPPEAIGSTSKQHNEESNVEAHNMLYVAVSRAKDVLTIFEDGDEYPFENVTALETAVSRGVLLKRNGAASTAVKVAIKTSTTFAPRTSVSNDEFLAYDRCPRQFLYRFGLEMGQELAPNPSLQARGLVKRMLKELAQTGRYDLLAQSFQQSWTISRLPEPRADPQLWEQAWAVAHSGATYLAGVQGQFIEVTADIGGVTVRLPWGLAVGDVGGVRLHCVDFYPAAGWYRTRQDNILRQMMSLTTGPARVVKANLYDMTRKTSREVAPVKVYDTSIVSTRTAGLRKGDFSPTNSSYPCARCAYSYVCPSLPSA